jgi:UDP-glucose 4-epimerase
MVYLQTSLGYGLRPPVLPVPPEAPLDEGGSSYAISKTAGERYLALGATPLVSFRLANIYGPRNRSGPVPTFFRRLTGGEPCVTVASRRDFLFVTDLIDLLARAVRGEGRPGFYNAATGRATSIPELYRRIAAEVAPDAPPPEERRPAPDDAPSILLDPMATRATFGWEATTTLAEGLPPTLAWYREHGVGRTYTHLDLAGST